MPKSGSSFTSMPTPDVSSTWIPLPPTPPPPTRVPKAPTPTTSASTVQRRPVPPTRLTLSALRDYHDDEVDAELRHLGLPFTRTTTRYANNPFIVCTLW